MAEARRNRTYRSTYRRPYGFEVRQAHQHPFASINTNVSNDNEVPEYSGSLDIIRAIRY